MRRIARGLAAIVLALCCGWGGPALSALVLGGCAHSGIRDDDEDYEGEEEEKLDKEEEEDRPRGKRRKRSRSSAPVLIQLRRLPDAVVESADRGDVRADLDELRNKLCDGREGDAVIFYQLIVAKVWHFYWICSDQRAQRAASPRGNEELLRWVRKLERRAEVDSAACPPGSRRRLFKETHDSGTRARAYCDGRIVLKFVDGGTKPRTFTSAAGGQTAPPAPDGAGRTMCPACPVCPQVATQRIDCPPPRPCPAPRSCPPPRECPPPKACPPPRECPPPKACPACDCREPMRAAGEKGFWQGVSKACRRICTMIYKKCRAIDPKTAMCYQMSEYCAETCEKK